MGVGLHLHPGMLESSRLRRLSSSNELASATEWAILIGTGIITACISAFVEFRLRVPGHAVLKVVFPVAAGMAMVPRRGSATVVGCTAMFTAIGLGLFHVRGAGVGFGAMTSLALIGPFLDLALRKASTPKLLYVGFACVGLFTNLLAMAVRGGLKMYDGGGRPIGSWFASAILTYPLCGIAAGLISAAVWFYARPGDRKQPAESAESPG